jgi:gluconate 2-dehydrogenase gamma chain
MADPDPPNDPERRRFLRHMAFASGGLYLVEWGWACKSDPPATVVPPPAPAAAVATPAPPRKATRPTDHKTFTNDEWPTLVAAVDRILPKDQDPGGVEAGVPDFIDHTLTDPNLKQMRDDFLGGLHALDRAATRRAGVPFGEAKVDEQDALLQSFALMKPESGEAHFYESLVTLCMEGFLGDPSYGGNKNRVGWALVGFEPGPPMPPMPGMKP